MGEGDIDDLFTVLDSDQEGTLELPEFVRGLASLMTEIKPKDLLVTQSIVKRLHLDLSKDFHRGLRHALGTLSSLRDMLHPDFSWELGQVSQRPDPPLLPVANDMELRLRSLEEAQERMAFALKGIRVHLHEQLPKLHHNRASRTVPVK